VCVPRAGQSCGNIIERAIPTGLKYDNASTPFGPKIRERSSDNNYDYIIVSNSHVFYTGISLPIFCSSKATTSLLKKSIGGCSASQM